MLCHSIVNIVKGSSVGPPTCQGLKDTYVLADHVDDKMGTDRFIRRLGADKVACQGVGGGYTASIMDNISATGTSRAGLAEGTKMVNLKHGKRRRSHQRKFLELRFPLHTSCHRSRDPRVSTDLSAFSLTDQPGQYEMSEYQDCCFRLQPRSCSHCQRCEHP